MRVLKREEVAKVSGAGGSCTKQGNNGYGNGGHDGVPGNSNKQDCTR